MMILIIMSFNPLLSLRFRRYATISKFIPFNPLLSLSRDVGYSADLSENFQSSSEFKEKFLEYIGLSL